MSEGEGVPWLAGDGADGPRGVQEGREACEGFAGVGGEDLVWGVVGCDVLRGCEFGAERGGET